VILRTCDLSTTVASISTVFVTTMLFCGCASYTAEYPSSWPRVDAGSVGSECPDISGKFKNDGESAQEDPLYSRLSDYIFETEVSGGGHISISQPDSMRVRIEANTANKGEMVREMRRDSDYTCSDGRLWISGSTWSNPTDAGGGFVVARSKWRASLAKAEEGSLLAEVHSSGGGVFFLFGFIPIPGGGDGTDYLMWPESD